MEIKQKPNGMRLAIEEHKAFLPDLTLNDEDMTHDETN